MLSPHDLVDRQAMLRPLQSLLRIADTLGCRALLLVRRSPVHPPLPRPRPATALDAPSRATLATDLHPPAGSSPFLPSKAERDLEWELLRAQIFTRGKKYSFFENYLIISMNYHFTCLECSFSYTLLKKIVIKLMQLLVGLQTFFMGSYTKVFQRGPVCVEIIWSPLSRIGKFLKIQFAANEKAKNNEFLPSMTFQRTSTGPAGHCP